MPRRDVMPGAMKVKWRCVVHDSCTRKVAYRSLLDAQVALGNDLQMQVYRCPFAEGASHWHLGHVPNMKALRKVASAIRARAQEVPA